jgi:glycosyltransferase involved in cell wall biosynthesis
MNKNINIFCIGKYGDDYRTQNTLKFFFDNENINVYYCDFLPPINNIASKLYKIFFMINCIFYMLRADIIYVFAMQHGSFPIQIAFFFKRKLVVDFYLSFYDTEINDYKHLIPNSKEAKRIKRVDHKAIINSRMVLFLNQSEAEYYTKILDVDINTITYHILPLCIDEKPRARIDYFLGKRECLNLCWCGSYVPLQGLDIILKAVSILKGKINLHLYIWGASDKRGESYQKIIENLHIQDIVTIHNEWGDRRKWENFIVNTCDVTLGIFGNSLKAKTVLANKVIDGVAFKTPVITAPSSGLFNFFNGGDDIYIVENNPEALALQIKLLTRTDYSEIKRRTENAYKIYNNNFTPEQFSKKLSDFLKEKFS